MTPPHDQFLAVRADLNACLLEREQAIDNALLALLTGEHFLMLGPPGTGKSMLVRAVCARLEGATYFEKAMSPVTVPEDIYGPIDLMRLADCGEWVRRDTGSMSRAHIVFLDEIARSNEAIRDTLLVAMNERIAQVVGFDPAPLPLISLFSASNSTFPPESAAFNDRFLLREIIQPLGDESNFVALLTGQLPDWRDVQASITLGDLRLAQAQVRQVKGTPAVAQAVLTLRAALSEQGIVVSDRKWRQCGLLLKARAWLDGQDALDAEHCTCLAHALWSDPKDAPVVARAVYRVACPLALRAVEIEDGAQEVFARLPATTESNYNLQAESILQQLTDAYHLLEQEMQQSHARDTTRPRQALEQIHRWHKTVSTAYFRRVSGLAL